MDHGEEVFAMALVTQCIRYGPHLPNSPAFSRQATSSQPNDRPLRRGPLLAVASSGWLGC